MSMAFLILADHPVPKRSTLIGQIGDPSMQNKEQTCREAKSGTRHYIIRCSHMTASALLANLIRGLSGIFETGV
jgi:hypothetical protein